MGYANDALRFLLELAALGSLAYCGFGEHDGVVQWLLGLGALVVLHLGLTFLLRQRPRQSVA